MEGRLLEQLLRIIEHGVPLSPISYVLVAIVALLSTWLGGYLSAKGKNIATKEDVATITRQVESVKTVFSERMEALAQQNRLQIAEYEQQNRLRLAALDKRLEVHQQAYMLWRKLLGAVNTDDVGKVVGECQTWWTQNCLYLNADVRDAFVRAWGAAWRHRDMLRSPDPTQRGAPLYANWNTIESCGEAIIKSAGLPGFGTYELQEVQTARQGNEKQA